MRYDVGRFRRPMRRGVMEQMVSLISLGDGSTLTLDFTTGVLDQRLTFTRGSNATFINSSGFVEWSASNHAPRTNWNFTSPTGSGWNAATLSGTGTFQWVGNGTVIAASGSAGQAFTIITTPTGIAEGLRYVMSVTASSVTGSPTIQSIFDFTSASGNTYFKNGAAATAGTTVASGDRISVSAIASATSMNVRIGCGAWFANRTNESVTLTQFHWHPGSAPVAYYENTGTSPRYDSARFDHDPTTLAPRGLLIEGQSENLCRNSNDIYVTAWWGSSAGITATQDTSIPDPSNGTQSCKIVKSAGTQFVVRNQILPTVTVPANSTVNVTASVWLRMNGAGQAAASIGIFDLGGTGFGTRNGAFVSNSAVTISSGSGSDVDFTFGAVTGWVRVGVTRSITNSTASPVSYTQLSFFIYPDRYSTNTATIFAWGAQFEIGAGASSLIPTGASTATRVVDYCTMPTSSFITGNPYPQTLLVDCIPATANTGFPNLARLFDRTAGGTFAYGSEIYYYTAATMSVNRKVSASTNSDRTLVTGLAYNTRHKFATAIDSTSFIGSRDGVTDSGATTAPAALASVVTHLGIGCNGDSSPANVMNGWMRQLKFWPTALPQATLNALTTL